MMLADYDRQIKKSWQNKGRERGRHREKLKKN